MKERCLKIALLLFPALVFILPVSVCDAQQQVVRMTDALFDNSSHQLILSEMEGWYFTQDMDIASVTNGISMTGWKKMQPAEFTESYADANGKAKGWFRITLFLDSSLKNIPEGMMSPIWAASDVYINGKLALSFGQTGTHDKAYRENRPYWKAPVPVELSPGKTYTILVHVVDQIVPVSGGSLKSSESFGELLILATSLTPAVNKDADRGLLINSVLLAITGVISILFWLFWLLNTNEKNQILFATCCTCISLCILTNILLYADRDLSFNDLRLNTFLFLVFLALVQLLVYRIITTVLHYKAHRLLHILVYIMIAIVFFTSQFPKFSSIAAFVNIPFVFVCMFIVASRWKKLKGAQWAMVSGLLSAIIFATLVFGGDIILPSMPQWAGLLIFLLAVASFPLGLMIYAAIRFREINHETEIQAGKVIQLSEEKKEQAIHQQKILEEEVRKQTADLRTTLDNLKATQAQLIQSEKMASLGVLTAGIAHEIQNPLNFVNNFSEVNTELIEELEQEAKKGNFGEVQSLVKDIKENEQKINNHGKRADAIVKGMLQHSRSNTGTKEPTDINALADEYLRLAYHGLRAKDNSFNVAMKTDFDKSIGNINLVAQDMGRVILNLINNAFYASSLPPPVGGFKDPNYKHEPTVWISTKKLDDKIEIRIKDNGPGIPPKILDKIFQPFFTTKPTGQGTGLGLSLSYDIVKAHGGEITVESAEGQGSQFSIILPAKISE